MNMKNISTFPCRKVFTDTLLELARLDRDIVAITTDARGSVTLDTFARELPAQFVELGIAEQNAVGVAAGLASAGKKAFVCGPACFYVARSLEQVKLDVAYSENPVKILGVSGGVSYGALGSSHHSLHDIAVLRTFPGMQVVLPCDIYQTKRLVQELVKYPYPVYIRVGRNAVPNVYENENIEFKIGKANLLQEGNDLTIIGTGETVYHCLQAGKKLSEQGLRTRVIDMHTLKPFDGQIVEKAALETGRIITVEEHSIFGGLGSAVAETVSQTHPVPLRILGIPDENAVHGTSLELFKYYGIDSEGIVEAALKFVGIHFRAAKKVHCRYPGFTLNPASRFTKMKYILAIDQSTSATKAMLFDEKAALVARASIDHKQYYPQPGWVEHDPEEILLNTYGAARLLLEKSGIAPADISSVAITNQRETVVVWDKRTGKPVYNGVVWQCNRGAKLCDELIAQGHESIVIQKTGLILNPYFSASGVKWILDHVKGAPSDARAGHLLLGTMDSWLIWNLTSGRVHATDYTNASRTLLFNIHTLAWDPELLRLFSIPTPMLPKVLPCDGLYGNTTMNGLLPEIPIAGVLGDSHGALAGQRCFSQGMGKATYGTGSSIMVNIGEKALPAPRGLVTSVAFAALGKVFYAFEGNIHCTGATIKWLQDELQLIRSDAETETLAFSVNSTEGVFFVPAFAGLGAPWWDNEAKALICGMNRGTTKSHIVRAALESIAYQVKDLLASIEGSGVALAELRVDGGPVKNKFLMQFQADILQANLRPSPIEEASALGAVVMNGFALKRWMEWEDAAKLGTRDESIVPQMSGETADSLYREWKKAVKRTLMK